MAYKFDDGREKGNSGAAANPFQKINVDSLYICLK